jgi:hypothetical protein
MMLAGFCIDLLLIVTGVRGNRAARRKSVFSTRRYFRSISCVAILYMVILVAAVVLISVHGGPVSDRDRDGNVDPDSDDRRPDHEHHNHHANNHSKGEREWSSSEPEVSEGTDMDDMTERTRREEDHSEGLPKFEMMMIGMGISFVLIASVCSMCVCCAYKLYDNTRRYAVLSVAQNFAPPQMYVSPMQPYA